MSDDRAITPTAVPKPVILITGTSRGLGAAMARRLSTWATVYGTSRKGGGNRGEINVLKMDVTESDSVQQAVEQLLTAEGRIDIQINNAGIVLSGASETTPAESASHQTVWHRNLLPSGRRLQHRTFRT